MKHQALAARCSNLAGSEALALDAAKRMWNVALPLAETAAGRSIIFFPLRSVLREMAKGGVVEGGCFRAQVSTSGYRFPIMKAGLGYCIQYNLWSL